MKKTLSSVALVAALLSGAQEAKAQLPYNSAVGLVFDGLGGSTVGIQYKQALNPTTAFQGQFAFRSNWVGFGADYQYVGSIPETDGLAWYAGGGANLDIASGGGTSAAAFGIRPQVGLEYKLPTVPIAVHLDYKPYIGITGGGGFDGGGFTFGVKYVLK